jgi:hypothetical protein
VDAGVNGHTVFRDQPFAEPLDQGGLAFGCQAVGQGDFNFPGDLGVFPSRVNLDGIP